MRSQRTTPGGESGFTEWTSLRRAKPLFAGHRQPRVPLDDHYYDLSDHAELIKQATLAHQYGVGGFCFYHYWFNGKRLLERPLEEMLAEKTPDFPFMLAWANHAWTRAWNEGGTKEILMPMEYGVGSDWDRHYDCLSRFFSDERYIRVDGKPVFLFFHPEAVPCLEQMLERWLARAKADGFDGIYFVRMLSVYSDPDWASPLFAAAVEFEPGFAIHNTIPRRYRLGRVLKRICAKVVRGTRLAIPKTCLQTFSYGMLVDNIIRRKPPLGAGTKIFPGVFVDWDNTARRRESGFVMLGWSVKLFERFLEAQMRKAQQTNAPFVFVNAWNEWAEGAYMEPDSENGLAILETVQRITNS